MSDDTLRAIVRDMAALERRMGAVETRTRPARPLPYAQRALNPLAATAVIGECAQLRDSTLMTFGASVFVNAPNSAINYWRLDLLDATAAVVVATANTSGATAGQWTRLAAASVTQPAAGNAILVVAATTVGAPGTIYVVPEVLAT